MLIDFGMSTMNSVKTCPCYDMKVFLRSMRRLLKKKKKTHPAFVSSSSSSAADIAKRLVFKA